jgi:hypothetical protein
MMGYHGPDGETHSTMDDRDKTDEWGEPVEKIDEEFSKMCAHNDDYDPLGDGERGNL